MLYSHENNNHLNNLFSAKMKSNTKCFLLNWMMLIFAYQQIFYLWSPMHATVGHKSPPPMRLIVGNELWPDVSVLLSCFIFAVHCCRRLPDALETGILSHTTTTKLSLGRSRLTKENRHAVQKETTNFKFGILVLSIYYFKYASKMNIVLFYTQTIDTCKDNWTPRRTGKGNVFKCFLACRSRQRVQCAF